MTCTEGIEAGQVRWWIKTLLPNSIERDSKNIMVSSSFGLGVINCKDYVYTRGFNAQGTLKSELE